MFPRYSVGEIGKISCWAILAFLNFVGFFFVQRYIYETKDKSIEDCVLLYQYSPYEEDTNNKRKTKGGRRRRNRKRAQRDYDDDEGLLDTR